MVKLNSDAMDAVILNNISKTYNKGQTIAVKDINLSVEKGALFGLIGPDGAGKTTLFRILTTLLLPDSGEALVDGMNVINDYQAIRKEVGYMPGKFSLYQDLTVEENLRFFATLFNTTIQQNYHLIKDIYQQIEPFKDRRAGKLSGGMKQKLALCCALIHKPKVLFLDEPTTGVDAVSRKEFWDMLKQLKQQGITIMVSTPYMDEATLCDRIALIQTGAILSVDTPDNIIKAFPEKLYAIRASDMYHLLKDVRNDTVVKSCFAFGEYIHCSFHNDYEQEINKLAGRLQQRGHQQVKWKQITPAIEDCFIRLLK